MKRSDCPHCGKKEAGYNHVRLCSAKNETPDNITAPTDAEPILETSNKIDTAKPDLEVVNEDATTLDTSNVTTLKVEEPITLNDPPKIEITPELILQPKRNYITCSFCGNPQAYNLNSIDMHCPQCGDYDTLSIKLKSMVPKKL